MKVKGKLLTAGLVVGGVLGTVTVVNKLTESMAGELNTVLTGDLAPLLTSGARILMYWPRSFACMSLICWALVSLIAHRLITLLRLSPT